MQQPSAPVPTSVPMTPAVEARPVQPSYAPAVPPPSAVEIPEPQSKTKLYIGIGVGVLLVIVILAVALS
jgi:hypothetical protein